MNRTMIAAALVSSAMVLQACEPAPTTSQQQQRQHEIACTSGTLGGALIGGVIGNQFGSGSGRDIMTVGGAVAGGVLGNRYSC